MGSEAEAGSMREYHRGFEDATDLIVAIAEKRLKGKESSAFISEVREVKQRVKEHKIAEIREQMGL